MRPVPSCIAALICLAAAGVPTLAAPVGLSIAVDANPSGTRVLLTFADPVGYELDSTEGKIEITFDKPVEVRPPLRFEGDDVLRRIRLRGDEALILTTGPAFSRHELFELRNPSRLILDLTGRPDDRTATDRRASRACPTVVVIDPGHGGSRTAAGRRLEGKDVTLDLAADCGRGSRSIRR